MANNDSSVNPMSEQQTGKPLQAWLVCLSAALFFFYEFMQMHMFSSISTELMDTFSLNATQLGLLSATFLYANTLFLLPAGLLLDRFSTRKIMLSSILLCTASTFGFAYSQSAYSAGFFHFLAGIGNAFCFVSCILLVTRWFPTKRQALLMGLIVTIAMLGGVLAQTPFALSVAQVGWRNTVLFDGMLGLIIIAFLWLNLQDHPPEYQQRREAEQQQSQAMPFGQSLYQAARNAQNWLCGLYTSFLNLPIMLLNALWGGLYLSQVHQMSMAQATVITSMIFFGSMLGSPLVGWLSDRMGKRKTPMLIGALAALLLMLAIMYWPALSYTGLLILFFMLGLVTSSQVLAYPMVAESNPNTITATATGLASIVIMGGAALAQPLFGWLLEQHSAADTVAHGHSYTHGDFHFALAIIPLGFIIGLLCIYFSKETHCQAHTLLGDT